MSSSIEGTDASGARCDRVDAVRSGPGQRVLDKRGGDDENIPVEEVGTGVGYFDLPLLYFWGESLGTQFSSREARATRFAGRGSDGEEIGSNAGSKVGVESSAGRLTPATGGKSINALREDDSIALRACWCRTRVE